MADDVTEHVLQQDDDAKNHGGRAHDGVSDQNRLGRGLERVARAVTLFQLVFGIFKIGIEAEGPLDFAPDAFP